MDYLNIIYKNVITDTSDVLNSTFGEFPIIFLDFKQPSGMSFRSVINSFKIIVQNKFMQHKYALHSNSVNEDNEEMFRVYKSQFKIVIFNEQLVRYFI